MGCRRARRRASTRGCRCDSPHQSGHRRTAPEIQIDRVRDPIVRKSDRKFRSWNRADSRAEESSFVPGPVELAPPKRAESGLLEIFSHAKKNPLSLVAIRYRGKIHSKACTVQAAQESANLEAKWRKTGAVGNCHCSLIFSPALSQICLLRNHSWYC